MERYVFEVEETRKTNVVVDAVNEKEAEEEVRRLLDQGSVNLDEGISTKTEITLTSHREVDDADFMKVLMVEPGKEPYTKMIGKDLSSMQNAVSGNIEAVYFFVDPIAIICNEDGKINGLPLNRSLKDEEHNVLDVIAGTFFICGIGGDDFSSITPDMEKKYGELFRNPESFIRLGEKLIAIPTCVPQA